MGNFLNQFDDDNYKNTLEKSEEQPVYVEIESERHDAAIQGPVHTAEVDRSFHRNRIIKLLIIAVAVIALCVTGIFIFRLNNRVEVIQLEGKDVSEAKNWALRNRIELNPVSEFNPELKKDVVIKQYPEAGKKIQRGSVVDITVSEGADPDEELKLPDFSTMQKSEIRDWINRNKANNISMFQEYSETVEKGGFLRMEFRDDTVNESNYTRKDMLVIYMSNGVEPEKKDISVPDFKNKYKEEAETWGQTNKVKINITEEASEEVEEKKIISQTVKAGEKVGENDEITVVISLGKGVTVPDFNNVFMDEAGSAEKDLNVETELKYNNSVAYGRVISQSVAAGTKLYGNDKNVKVVYSLGRPYIDDLKGSSEKDLPALFYDYKSKGANITYSVAYVDSYESKGTVVSASRSSEYLPMAINIQIEISRGNLEPPEPEIPNPPGNENPPL